MFKILPRDDFFFSPKMTIIRFHPTKLIIATRGFAPRCGDAESLGPEGTLIGYKTKRKRTNKKRIKRKKKLQEVS